MDSMHRDKVIAFARFLRECSPRRTTLASALLVVAVGLLLGELVWLLLVGSNFSPTDFEVMVRWGRAAQGGDYYSFYPLPTLLWIFLPLSLLPAWFIFVWTVLPFGFILVMFRKRGVILWLYVPTLVQAAWGHLDGLFLLPLYWLFQNHASLAAVSAALLTLKPQLALFPVSYMLCHCLRVKNWQGLGCFAVTILILYVPAFLVDPR